MVKLTNARTTTSQCMQKLTVDCVLLDDVIAKQANVNVIAITKDSV